MFSDHDLSESSAAVADDSQPENFSSDETPRPKRNCGRTGPTSETGRARSAQNSTKHGACAQTLLVTGEREEDWLLLLKFWTDQYKPAEDTVLYTFVLKTAQAEWTRLRCQRQYDDLMAAFDTAPYNFTPEQERKHNLMMRYKTTAERCFQREYRQLEQHFKAHHIPKKSDEFAPKEETAETYDPKYIMEENPKSPTGLFVLLRVTGTPELDAKFGRKTYHKGDPYP
jgi:hypothetical protein